MVPQHDRASGAAVPSAYDRAVRTLRIHPASNARVEYRSARRAIAREGRRPSLLRLAQSDTPPPASAGLLPGMEGDSDGVAAARPMQERGWSRSHAARFLRTVLREPQLGRLVPTEEE